MNEVNRTKSGRKDASRNPAWDNILTGILFIATCLLVLGFFLQSIVSAFLK